MMNLPRVVMISLFLISSMVYVSAALAQQPKSSWHKEEKKVKEAQKAARNVIKIKMRIRELEVLDPILKAEVLTVTKMASRAQSIKERREATKKIRKAENNAIAVIRELRDLKKRLDIAQAEVEQARIIAGLSRNDLVLDLENSVGYVKPKYPIFSREVRSGALGFRKGSFPNKMPVRQEDVWKKRQEDLSLDNLEKELLLYEQQQTSWKRPVSSAIKSNYAAESMLLADLDREMRRSNHFQRIPTKLLSPSYDGKPISYQGNKRNNQALLHALRPGTRKKSPSWDPTWDVTYRRALKREAEACFRFLDILASSENEVLENQAHRNYESAKSNLLQIVRKAPK